MRKAISHLEDGGVGALEFLAHRQGSRLRLAGSWMEKHVPLFHNFVNLLRGRSWSEPLMEMNIYNLNQIVMDLYDANCDNIHIQPVTHPGCVGAMVFFQKNSKMDKTPLNQ